MVTTGPHTAKTALVTGGNRGIGLELVRQLAEKGWQVYAGMRAPERSEELMRLAGAGNLAITPLTLDVTSGDQIAAAVSRIDKEHGRLDLLLNNAADYGHNEEGVEQTRAEEMLRVLAVNAVAPVIITRHCLALLEAAVKGVGGVAGDSPAAATAAAPASAAPASGAGGPPIVATVSSGAALLREELPEPGSQYSYQASKAALNIYLMRLAADLRARGIVSVGLSPGFVLTGMTRAAGLSPTLLPPESAAGLIRVIEGLTPADAGKFYRYTGEQLHWAVEA